MRLFGRCSRFAVALQLRSPYWDFYERVNRKFADAVERLASRRPDWIHDYQLCRRWVAGPAPQSRLAFFLHIRFRHPTSFAKLPCGTNLQTCWPHDLVGVQTGRDPA